MNHLLPLGETEWSVWTDGLLRSAGFPANGLEQFAAQETAHHCDEFLSGQTDGDIFDKSFNSAVACNARSASAVAADPLVREAITWQNPGALHVLDGLSRTADDCTRNGPRRAREKTLLRYWQRYCGKSETIGFFGPILWTPLEPADFAVSATPGANLVRGRRVFFEHWAMRAFADAFAGRLEVRQWWAPVLRPHLTLRGRVVHGPLRQPIELSSAEATAVASCDGRRAVDVANTLCDDPDCGVRTARDAYLLLDRLVAREVLRWDAGVPTSLDAEHVVHERIAAIEDPAAKAPMADAFSQLLAARAAVADSAGDPEALRSKLSNLDELFSSSTGIPPRQREGQSYAGRTLVYEDTERDADVVVGTRLLDRLAEPLAILLRAARWLSAELAAACATPIVEVYREQGSDEVPLTEIWYLAQGLIWGGAGSPAAEVEAEFVRRWATLFGIAEHDDNTAEISLSAHELASRAATLFDAAGPGWPSARIHNADVLICATSVDEINTGRPLFVLGELHPAHCATDSAMYCPWHPDPGALRAGFDHDIGPARLRVRYPDTMVRQTGRTQHGLDGPLDRFLGVEDTPGVDPAKLIPSSTAVVTEVRGELRVHEPGGASWPLLEAFDTLLGARLMDSFKLLEAAEHTPRITLDDLVVARETWRTTIDGTGLATVTGERERYVAARRWRLESGLPERAFVKIGTEVKPFYVDFTSPLSLQMLATMLRTARREHGDDVTVVLSEVLPAPRECWLPDAAGNRYVSEFRLQFTDPLEYTPATGALQ